MMRPHHAATPPTVKRQDVPGSQFKVEKLTQVGEYPSPLIISIYSTMLDWVKGL